MIVARAGSDGKTFAANARPKINFGWIGASGFGIKIS
jgi:hypothetical protein